MDTVFVAVESYRVAGALGLAMLAAWAFGRWHGRRLRLAGEEPVSKFDDASLALLGLLLAFTFSMAMVKHDQRRLMVIADANAIGDFYTCATLLPEPVRSKLQTVIRDYTQLRIDIAGRGMEEANIESAITQMEQMHSRMVELVGQALAAGTSIAVPLTNTLNAVTSNHAARLAAAKDKLPTSIVLLLMLSAVVSSLLVGRDQGLKKEVDAMGTVCFVLLISFAVYVTLDLNQPHSGLIRVSQEPMQRLLSSMKK